MLWEGSMGSGLVCILIASCLLSPGLANPGGAVFPGRQGPRCQSIKNMENMKI